MKEHHYNFNVSDSGKMRLQGREDFDLKMKENVGKRGVITVIYYDERSPKQIIGYYYAYIVPEFIKWYRENERTHYPKSVVHEKLVQLSAITKDLDTSDLFKLSVIEVYYFIEDIKQIAAENFNLFLY